MGEGEVGKGEEVEGVESTGTEVCLGYLSSSKKIILHCILGIHKKIWEKFS